MSVLLATAMSMIAFVVAGLMYRGRGASKSCPTCHVDYVLLSSADEDAHAAYDVLACPTCSNTVTRVHGTASRHGYCTACRNRAMEVTCDRLPGPSLQVEVHESCGLCGHTHTFELGVPAEVRMAEVIPFPTERARKSGSDSSERRGG